VSKVVVRALPEILSFIVDNRGRSCPTAEGGIPLIATNCLKPGVRSPVFENIRHVSDETYRTWFRAHPEPGDVLFVCKGSPGRVAVVPDPVPFCIAQDMLALRADPTVVDPLYLYYRLASRDVQNSISTMHVGTMIPHFKKGDFGKLRFTVHESLAEQRAIAEVLGALDDKIAANDRVVRTLQELADAKYGQAVMELVPGEVTFATVAEVSGGGTPSTSVGDYWDGDIAWATPTDVTALPSPYLRDTKRKITKAGLKACSSGLYPPGSILMTSRATIGAFAIAELPVAVNQGFIVVNAKNPDAQWWLFHEMRSRVTELQSYANGATFLELPRGRFKDIPIRLAGPGVVRQFSEDVSVFHRTAAHFSSESRELASARDELLPLLMTGRVSLNCAEKVAEEVC
jgi:type I restriction enzyme S subunit